MNSLELCQHLEEASLGIVYSPFCNFRIEILAFSLMPHGCKQNACISKSDFATFCASFIEFRSERLPARNVRTDYRQFLFGTIGLKVANMLFFLICELLIEISELRVVH